MAPTGPQPPNPPRQNYQAINTSPVGHDDPGVPLPSPVPRNSPVTPGWFPKEGPQPFLWS